MACASDGGQLHYWLDLDRNFLHQLNKLPSARHWRLEYVDWVWLCRRRFLPFYPLALITLL